MQKYLILILFILMTLCSTLIWAQDPTPTPVKTPEISQESKSTPPKENIRSMKDLVAKLISDLESKQKLNPKNLADALREQIKATVALNKELKPEQIKDQEKNIESLLSKIESLDKEGHISAEKLKESTLGIMSAPPESRICKKEKETCEEKAGCCEGLKCIPTYPKVVENKDDKNKVVFKCVKPIKLGLACEPMQSVCETGSCIDFYTNSTVLPICSPFGKSCKKDAECCSTICDDNKCNTNYRCLNCIRSGQKIDPAKPDVKCCEGLYNNLDGMCVSDYPPQASVRPAKKKSFLLELFDLLIPSAQADNIVVAPDENSNFATCTFYSKRNYNKQLQQAIDTIGTPDMKDSIDAIRAFEFMGMGPGVEDMWKDGAGKTIHARAKILAQSLRTVRLDMETKFKAMDDFMTCNCIDIKGIDDPSVTAAQKTFFTSSCATGALNDINSVLTQGGVNAPTVALGPVTQTGVTPLDDMGVGASGIKYKEMLIRYFAKRIEIQSAMLEANVAPAQGFLDIANFIDSRDWDKQNKTTRYWDAPNVYKTVPEEWADMIASFIGDIIQNAIGPVKNAVAAINSIPSSSVLWKIPLLWRLGFSPPNCWEWWSEPHYACVGDVCTRYASTHHFKCSEEINAPNDVCGMLAPNSFCVKTAIKRTDHSSSGENRYLIDPLIPDGYTLPHPLNIFGSMNWNTGAFPTFTINTFDDARYGSFKDFASLYAKNQDFYQTQVDQDKFGVYVIDKHLFQPYLSNAGAVKYPTPGIVSYYEDMYNRLEFMSDVIAYIAEPPDDPNDPNDGGDGDLDLFIKYANDYVKTVNGLAGGGKITPGLGHLQGHVTEAKNAVQMVGIYLTGVKTGNIPSSKDFDQYRNGYFSSKTFSDFGKVGGSRAIAKARKKKIYDDWMSKVGNTAKGKAMLDAKRHSLDGIYGASGSGAGSGTAGNSSNSSQQDDSAIKGNKADDDSKKSLAKAGESTDEDNSGDYGGGRRSNRQNYDTSANSKENIKEVLEETKSKNYQPINEDSLWQIVSKAYVRGAYPNLLYGQPGIPLNKDDKKPELVIDDEKVFAPTKSVKRKAPSNPSN